jgi:glycosidase
LDLPINHTGHLNQWFSQFKHAHQLNDESNPYYDFYTYYKMGEQAPSGRTFTLVNGTDTYYECNFSNDMPELNFDNPVVRETVLDVAKYYLDLGVDGFRFDAAKYVYLNEDDKSADFWGWYVDELKKVKPDIYTVGEVWDADSITFKYFKNGLGCFNFSTSGAEGKIAQASQNIIDINVYTKYVKSYYNQIQSYDSNAMMYSFITNHDMDRTAGFLPLLNKTAYMGASIELLSPGSPFIYYGDEIGMTGSRGGANTDANRRLKMLWGDGDTVKNPIGWSYDESKQVNGTVKSHLEDEYSLLTHYKKLIMIRNAYPEIYSGSFESLKYNYQATSLGGFEYSLGDSKVVVIHNVSKTKTQTVELTTLTSAQVSSLQVYIGAGVAKLEGINLTIDPLTTVILK